VSVFAVIGRKTRAMGENRKKKGGLLTICRGFFEEGMPRPQFRKRGKEGTSHGPSPPKDKNEKKEGGALLSTAEKKSPHGTERGKGS